MSVSGCLGHSPALLNSYLFHCWKRGVRSSSPGLCVTVVTYMQVAQRDTTPLSWWQGSPEMLPCIPQLFFLSAGLLSCCGTLGDSFSICVTEMDGRRRHGSLSQSFVHSWQEQKIGSPVYSCQKANMLEPLTDMLCTEAVFRLASFFLVCASSKAVLVLALPEPALKCSVLSWRDLTSAEHFADRSEHDAHHKIALWLLTSCRSTTSRDNAPATSELSSRLLGSLGTEGRMNHADLLYITPRLETSKILKIGGVTENKDPTQCQICVLWQVWKELSLKAHGLRHKQILCISITDAYFQEAHLLCWVLSV